MNYNCLLDSRSKPEHSNKRFALLDKTNIIRADPKNVNKMRKSRRLCQKDEEATSNVHGFNKNARTNRTAECNKNRSLLRLSEQNKIETIKIIDRKVPSSPSRNDYKVRNNLVRKKVLKNSTSVENKSENFTSKDFICDIFKRPCYIPLVRNDKQLVTSNGTRKMQDCFVILEVLNDTKHWHSFDNVKKNIEHGTSDGIGSKVNPKSMKSNLSSKQTKFTSKKHDSLSNQSIESHRFRKRDRKVNYKDMSLNNSQKTTPITKKVRNRPIYRQISIVDKKMVKDIYEFNSKSDFKRKRKADKNLESDSDSSQPFEKYMKDVVQNLEKKTIALERRNQAAKKTIQTGRDGVIRRSQVQMKTKKTATNKQRNEYDKNKINKKQIPKSKPSSEIINVVISNLSINSNKNDEKHDMQFAEKTPLHNSSPSHQSCDGFQENDNDYYINTSPVLSKNKSILNIISDVTIPNKTIDFDSLKEPVANSTMLNESNVQPSPWRPLFIRRNPHFLHLKDSFLPTYNQEMVLESSVVETLLNTSVKAPVSTEVEKSIRQTKITKYTNEIEEKVPDMSCSLFDDDKFSPIKKNTINSAQGSKKKKSVLENKENSPEQNCKIGDKVKRAKRNILTSRVNNEENCLGIPSITNYGLSSDESDFFGFDNSHKVEIVKQTGKPTRMDFIVKPMAKNRVEFDAGDATACSSKNSQDFPNDTNNSPIVGLFEDFEPERNFEFSARTYAVKSRRMRRHRSPSLAGSEDESDNDHHHKRKRQVHTKKEIEEVETWAAAFNSMCKEVEDFPLEIE